MSLALKGARIYTDGRLAQDVFAVDNGQVVRFSELMNLKTLCLSSDCIVIPGLTDVHVHFREPGFSYKETIKSGCAAAARGGYTAVCTMPNLSPSPDSLSGLAVQEACIREHATVHVYPYGCITKGSRGEVLSDMDAISRRVIAFSDDGRGVQSDDMMKEAMRTAKRLGKMIVAHCEDERLVGGCLHDGAYARKHGYRGIPSECEWRQLERDLRLVKEIDCSYHVCHVSCKESVELIRQAKAAGLDVTAETAPHYLVLCEDDIVEEHARYKMNPPLRAKSDREALVEGLSDGTIDMIATDHAPHTPEEKSRGFVQSPMGVTGLECAFAVLYTNLVKRDILSLETLIERMAIAPRRRFHIGGGTKIGDDADFAVFDLSARGRVRGQDFVSMGKSTPFEGMEIFGKCLMTAVGGNIVWQEK